MIEKGIVKEINKDNAIIEIVRSDACAGCEGCLLSENGKMMLLTAKAPEGLSSGDIVTLEISSRAVLSSGFLVFIVPLLVLIVGIVAGERIISTIVPSVNVNGMGIIIGFVFMLLAFVIVYFLERRASRKSALSPRIIRVEKGI